MHFPGLHQFVDFVESCEQCRTRLIRVQLGTSGVSGALLPILAVLRRFHVPEEPQYFRVVRRGLPQLVQLPAIYINYRTATTATRFANKTNIFQREHLARIERDYP